MSKAVFGAAMVVLFAGGAAFYAQNKANSGLRREIAGLREDVQSVMIAAKANPPGASRSPIPVHASAENMPTPAAGAEELAQLRQEIAALRKSTLALTQLAQTAQAAQALAKTSESIPTKLTPAGELKNAGKATPEASTETALWAAVGGDIDALAGTMTFTPSAKIKAEAWFAGLSENTRQQYGSPEKVIALMIARDAAALTGMQVLGQKDVTPDDVGVRVRFASSEGKTKDDTLLMHRAADGWRMVLPDSAVEKFARQLGGGR